MEPARRPTLDAMALPDAAQPSRLSRWWHGIPIRWQILTAILATFLITGLLAGSVGVIDARGRANVETSFHLELWQQYIGAQFSKLDTEREIESVVAVLGSELSRARHITATLTRRDGTTIKLTSRDEDRVGGDDGDAPAWFIRLVQPRPDVRNVDLTVRGQRVASISLAAKPDDEIAEAWVLLRKLAIWSIAGLVLTTLGLYFILGYVLGPLTSFASGMRELEDGHYDVRLPDAKIQELSAISDNFNKLASALQKAKADNARLYRQLIAVQEDERRQIAADLHDEVGPCLFGIMANTGSIKRLAQALPAEQSQPILAAASELVTISDKLRAMNRSLLARLRPVALGRVSVADLLSDLVTGFARANPDVRFGRAVEGLPHTFGEAIDLTIYRCVQEGITNALRHGKATAIDIRLSLTGAGRPPSAGNSHDVFLAIADNGRGLAPATPFGFGITAMRERVRLLNGTLAINPGSEGGTMLSITIPIPTQQAV